MMFSLNDMILSCWSMRVRTHETSGSFFYIMFLVAYILLNSNFEYVQGIHLYEHTNDDSWVPHFNMQKTER